MKPTRLLPLAASLTLAAAAVPTAHAQKSFDLIVPTAMEHPVFPAGSLSSTSVGLIVNTGTEPIAREEVSFAMYSTRSSATLLRCEVSPTAGNWSVLQPGEAAGSADPIYQQLLATHETLIPGGFGAYFVRSNNPVGTSARITTHLELGDRRSRSAMDVTWVPLSQGFRVTGVQRVSAVAVPLGVETLAEGCPLPDGSSWGLSIRGDFGQEAGRTGVESDLPVLGNEKLEIHPGLLPSSEIGMPYVIIWGLGDRTFDLLGCPSIVFLDALGAGTVQAGRRRFAEAAEIPAPIPNDPILAGAQIGVQAVLLSPNSSNGIGTLSRALTLNLFADTDA